MKHARRFFVLASCLASFGCDEVAVIHSDAGFGSRDAAIDQDSGTAPDTALVPDGTTVTMQTARDYCTAVYVRAEDSLCVPERRAVVRTGSRASCETEFTNFAQARHRHACSDAFHRQRTCAAANHICQRSCDTENAAWTDCTQAWQNMETQRLTRQLFEAPTSLSEMVGRIESYESWLARRPGTADALDVSGASNLPHLHQMAMQMNVSSDNYAALARTQWVVQRGLCGPQTRYWISAFASAVARSADPLVVSYQGTPRTILMQTSAVATCVHDAIASMT